MGKIYVSKHGQHHLTLPKALALAKGFKHGTEVEWVIDNLGQLILKPKA